MATMYLNKTTKQFMGYGNEGDIDLSVQTDLEFINIDVAIPWEELQTIDPDTGIEETEPFRWTGTGWQLIGE